MSEDVLVQLVNKGRLDDLWLLGSGRGANGRSAIPVCDWLGFAIGGM